MTEKIICKAVRPSERDSNFFEVSFRRASYSYKRTN
ncbi:hypothetical protein GGR07_002823 [Bacteroides pyogenes]|nr:hypothetical protein [Bacteroides pyogenes]